MPRILVTGAESLVGRHIVEQLAERQLDIKAVYSSCRSPNRSSNQANIGWYPESKSSEQSLSDCDGAVFVGPMHRKLALSRTKKLEYFQGLFDSALAAGLQRVIYVSTAWTTFSPDTEGTFTEDDFYTPGSTDKEWLETNFWLEAMTYRYLKEGLQIVPVLPTLPIGSPESRFPARWLLWYLAAGKVPISLAGRTNVVDVKDIAESVTNALFDGRPGRRYILGGQTISVPKFLNTCDRIRNVKQRRVTLPVMPFRKLLETTDHWLKTDNHLLTGIASQFDELTTFPAVCSDRAEAELGHSSRSLDKMLREMFK